MFKTLKKLFGRRAESRTEAIVEEPPRAGNLSEPSSPGPAPQPETSSNSLPPSNPNASLISLPLKLVIGQLQGNLRSRVRIIDTEGAEVQIPIQKVFPQLSRGAVKFPFGELRQMSPPGAFATETDLDRSLVQLPLPEILARINPALLLRRATQKKVSLPVDVAGPFGPQGEGLKFAVAVKGEAGKVVLPPSEPIPQAAAPLEPIKPIKPAKPATSDTSITPLNPISPIAPIPAQPMAKAQTPVPSPGARAFTFPVTPRRDSTPPVPPASPVISSPSLKPPATPYASNGKSAISVSLAELAEAWPETVCREIFQLRLSNANVNLPIEVVEIGLKQGKLAFPWRLIKSWLSPAPAAASPSVNDGALLDLPLKAIAPLFMASQRKTPAAQTPEPKALAEPLTAKPPPAPVEPPPAPPDAQSVIPMTAALRDLAPRPPNIQPPKAPSIPAPPAKEPLKPFSFTRPATPAAPAPTPIQRAAVPPPPVQPPAEPFTFTRRDQPATPIAPVPPPAAPSAPVGAPAEPLAEPFSFKRQDDSTAADAPTTVPSEPKGEEPLEPFSFKHPEEPVAAPIPTPAPAPVEAAPIAIAPVSQPAPPVFDGPTLSMPLADLSEAWPESARDVIAKSGLSATKVEAPLELIGNALKQGKAAFAWKQICSWTKPASPELTAAVEENTVVELPLKFIAPLFLAQQKFPRPSKAISIDDDIPDLFSNTSSSPAPVPAAPAATAAPAPSEKPDTNYYTWEEQKESSEGGEEKEEEKVLFKSGPSPGTSFLNRYATPNEIVSKAAALDGVDGVLIALPDGLLVASKIPSSMNGDILAAFLPQIYGRLSQSTRELRMGELNNLSFTVGNIPWKIFRVGAIYFAAFGLAGQPLPGAQLAGVAAELDRKPSNKV
jgi:predicted regulator of Ras-like GTPase activity (Roadblock/LC7/MglB family)